MLKSIVQLLGAAPPSQIDALSRQVADGCVQEVCATVQGKVEAMTFSEARGYVRARAVRVVRKRARQSIAQQVGAKEAWIEAVARAATEKLVPTVLRQTGVGVPAAATQLRLVA